MNPDLVDVASQVMQVFRETGAAIARVQLATGLRCVPGCGSCCESPHVEATVVEALPLAVEVYRRREEGHLFDAVSEKDLRGDPVCVLYRPEADDPRHGRCTYYDFRFLLCRLFGFSARRGKTGTLEFSPCKVMKEKNPEAGPAVSRWAGLGLAENRSQGALPSSADRIDLPVYQDAFMRIAGIEPGSGFIRYPVNAAIRKALERFYWKGSRPDSRFRQAENT